MRCTCGPNEARSACPDRLSQVRSQLLDYLGLAIKNKLAPDAIRNLAVAYGILTDKAALEAQAN